MGMALGDLGLELHKANSDTFLWLESSQMGSNPEWQECESPFICMARGRIFWAFL